MLSFIIGKSYQDVVKCKVIDIHSLYACHVLSKQLKDRVRVVHKVKQNIFIFS